MIRPRDLVKTVHMFLGHYLAPATWLDLRRY